MLSESEKQHVGEESVNMADDEELRKEESDGDKEKSIFSCVGSSRDKIRLWSHTGHRQLFVVIFRCISE